MILILCPHFHFQNLAIFVHEKNTKLSLDLWSFPLLWTQAISRQNYTSVGGRKRGGSNLININKSFLGACWGPLAPPPRGTALASLFARRPPEPGTTPSSLTCCALSPHLTGRWAVETVSVRALEWIYNLESGHPDGNEKQLDEMNWLKLIRVWVVL